MAKNSSESNETTPRHVLVTTQHRGVFFGVLVGEPSKEKVMLNAARNVVFWDAATKGFLGLAAEGPTKGCRISKPAGEQSVIFDITGVWACTPEAVKKFEDAPWA